MRYAQINQNSIVENVVVLNDELYASFGQDEKQFFIKDPSIDNPNIRGVQIGMQYLSEYGRFVFPSPFPSWVFSMEKNDWVPPIPFPEEVGHYEWVEETTSWKVIPE